MPARLAGLFVACCLVALSPAGAAAKDGRTLLAIFAHADDEASVGSLLARYAREGAKVHLAIATDGQKGVWPHAGIPAGEKLAARRAEEARCACEALGIEPPILIGLEDGATQEESNMAALSREVAHLFYELKPDVVITWGPDGLYGHPDHRIVSSIVTEVYQAAEHPPGQLYYQGFSAEEVAKIAEALRAQGRKLPMRVGAVRERFLPARIAYAEEDAAANARALACHESQYTPEQAAALAGFARALQDGGVTLRPWFVDPGPVTDLFE